MRIFLSFFQTRPAQLPQSLERKVAAGVQFLNTIARFARKNARRIDFKNRSLEERRERGSLIERVYFKRALIYAKSEAIKFVEDGQRFLRSKPPAKDWNSYLQRFLGFLQYSLALFTNGQVVSVMNL